MTVTRIDQIGVIGAGTMGRGIAHTFSLFGYPVILVDREKGALDEAWEAIKGRTDPAMWDQVARLITLDSRMETVRGCDLVIEAVFEVLSVKQGVLEALGRTVKDAAVIATNTSSISINKLATRVKDPSRFIGMHFMNPPKVMKLVEVVKGSQTSDETVQVVTAVIKNIDKIPALVNDAPGFVANRLLFALIGEALTLLEKGVATQEDIDVVMKHGMNHPMGPIALADFIGLDICLSIMGTLYEELGDERYKPSPRLESLVREGKLGQKTGEGFYKYSPPVS